MRETEMEVLLCKTQKKNPETDGYDRDRSPRSEKLKRDEIMLTETRKTETRKKAVSRNQSERGARCLWRGGFEKEKRFEVGKRE